MLKLKHKITKKIPITPTLFEIPKNKYVQLIKIESLPLNRHYKQFRAPKASSKFLNHYYRIIIKIDGASGANRPQAKYFRNLTHFPVFFFISFGERRTIFPTYTLLPGSQLQIFQVKVKIFAYQFLFSNFLTWKFFTSNDFYIRVVAHQRRCLNF